MNGDGQIHIVHTGKIGGVHSVAGRRLFRERSAVSRQWTYAELSGKRNDAVVVSTFYDNLLVQSLVRFT